MPEVLQFNDYDPFGMLTPDRHGGENYRYGFNTQEKTDEIAGEGNHTTAMYWEYDTRIGRRWNRDPITFSWQSTYAVNNNNPIVYTDPLGLFGSRKEAREYKKEHGLKGRIKKGNDGIYSIINKKEGVSYFKDPSLDGEPNVIGRQDDGVIKSVFIGEENSGPSEGAFTAGVKEFGKRGDKLKVSSNRLKTTGKFKFYDNGWGGNQFIKTKRVFNSGLTKAITNHAPGIGNVLDAVVVINGIQEDGNRIGANTAIQAAGVVGGSYGAGEGALLGATIGSAICPGVGTIIGGVGGAIVGSWLGERAAEAVTSEVLGE